MTMTLRSPRINSIAIPDDWGRTDCLIIIPARNEADRIGGCLAVLSGQGADVMVVANNCSDATVQLASQTGAAVIDYTVLDGGVGAARRLGAAEGLRRMPDARWLMTSDADCEVASDWVTANRRYLDDGAAAVCGLVLPIPEEHAALPPALLRRAALENRFLALKAQLEAHLTGEAGHEQTPGASLAFKPLAYAAVGGLPCPPPLPWRLASSDPVARFSSTMSLTNLTEIRNCAAFAISLGPMALRWLTPVRVTFLNKINDALMKLHRKWFAHQ